MSIAKKPTQGNHTKRLQNLLALDSTIHVLHPPTRSNESQRGKGPKRTLSNTSISTSQLRSYTTFKEPVPSDFDSTPGECWNDVVLLFNDRCTTDNPAEDSAPEDTNVSLEMLFQLAILPLRFDRATDGVSVPSELVPGPLLVSSRSNSVVEGHRVGCSCIWMAVMVFRTN